jgi:hypothetical protein
VATAAAFTVPPPVQVDRSPPGYRPGRQAAGMADLLVVLGVVAFVAAMLGLIRGLERV